MTHQSASALRKVLESPEPGAHPDSRTPGPLDLSEGVEERPGVSWSDILAPRPLAGADDLREFQSGRDVPPEGLDHEVVGRTNGDLPRLHCGDCAEWLL